MWDWLFGLFLIQAWKKQRRTRGVESKEGRKHGDLVVPGNGERCKYWSVHGPRLPELGPRAGRATGYTFFRCSPRVRLLFPGRGCIRFARLAMGYSKPPILRWQRTNTVLSFDSAALVFYPL